MQDFYSILDLKKQDARTQNKNLIKDLREKFTNILNENARLS